MRRKRWVLALQAVKRAAAIGGSGSPEAHCMVLRFCHAAQAEQVSFLGPALSLTCWYRLSSMSSGKANAEGCSLEWIWVPQCGLDGAALLPCCPV